MCGSSGIWVIEGARMACACRLLYRFDVTIRHVLVMHTNDVVVPPARGVRGYLRQSGTLLFPGAPFRLRRKGAPAARPVSAVVDKTRQRMTRRVRPDRKRFCGVKLLVSLEYLLSSATYPCVECNLSVYRATQTIVRSCHFGSTKHARQRASYKS